MVARADGTDVVTLMPDVRYADWSPDDTQFVVSHYVDGELVVSIVAADGTGIPRTIDIGGLRLGDWGPEWRPTDGAELIFMAQTPGTQDNGIYGIRPDGTGLRTIGEVSTAYNAWQESFQRRSLSPDGTSIAYSNWEADDTGVKDIRGHLRDLTTGVDRRIAEAYPVFSPDGTTVLGEGPGGWIMERLDGSQPLRTIRVPQAPEHGNRAFYFSPDGTKLLFSVGEPRRTWIIDLASGTSAETSQPIRDLSYWQRLARLIDPLSVLNGRQPIFRC